MTPSHITEPVSTELGAKANRHLWGHFARHGEGITPPIITRGEGVRIWDDKGRSYIDGLSGLFVVQVGHGRKELAEAAAKQAETLSFFPLWSYATPPAIELAERIANYAPGDLNRVFFTTGGGEAVESAWKLAKQYFKLTGKPGKHKVVSRAIAYHGTPQGALAITGIPAFKAPFEPLTPGGFRAPNTNFYRAATICPRRQGVRAVLRGPHRRDHRVRGTRHRRGRVPRAGAERRWLFRASPGYFERVREICDEYDVLLVSDEVICAYGRIGSMFACEDFGYVPDIITSAKGLTSGYSPLGAMIASDRLFEPFNDGKTTSGTATPSAGIRCPRRWRWPTSTSSSVRASTTTSRRTPRRSGPRWRSSTKETFGDDESERLLRGFLTPALWEAGLYCRADDRGDPVVQLAPPLISGQAEFDAIYDVLQSVLSEAARRL